ncbi:type III secretion system effector TmeB [Chlamydia trachomatis]|uniref:type III secretion system effector TmeB n=1 Tax=Chlamydia trachomatis TaxID=813 RepID=UPI0002A7F0ED|nr:hypothetical protein [Chlamydia trachomatis]CCP62742.1 hypothetical protein L1440_00738 [Chlamydia trachomatis L1/440/LN]
MSSISPIGGNSGPEGFSSASRGDEIDDVSDSEEGELEERVSDHAESIITESSETLFRTTSSSGVSEDLQQHVSLEESPRQRGFLGRIRDAVASIWKRRVARRNENYDVKKAEEQQGIVQYLQDSKMPALTRAYRHLRAFNSACLRTIREFFATIFRALRDAYYRHCTRSGINFCGADKDSLEVLVAVGLLLRMATLRSFEHVGGNYEDRLVNNDAPVTGAGRTLVDDAVDDIESILNTRTNWPQHVMIGFSRGLVQLCATPYNATSQECFKSIVRLEKEDPSSDYSQALLLAGIIDRLAEKAPMAAKYVLDALRVRTSELIGELIILDLLPPVWKVGRGGVFPPVNEQLVVQIVNANVERLHSTFAHEPQAYLRMIEGLVTNFFFLPSEEDPSSVGNI